MAYPKQIKSNFANLKASGLSYDKIALELDISKPTLLKWGEELKYVIIEEARQQAEHLVSEFKLIRQARLKGMQERLENINLELQSRDLTEVSTKELFQIEESLYKSYARQSQIVNSELKFNFD